MTDSHCTQQEILLLSILSEQYKVGLSGMLAFFMLGSPILLLLNSLK
jgi:hypothetical protein